MDGSFVVLRMDGKAFHTYTKAFARPYDFELMDATDNATLTAVREVFNTGFVCAYTQSDEISIVLDWRMVDKTFGGRIEKLVSVGTSAVTAGFLESAGFDRGLPLFDARLITLDSIDEVEEYLNWRRLDCQKNAISMAVETMFSHEELKNVSTSERKELLRGSQYEELPDGFYWGRLICSKPQKFSGTFTHSKTGEVGEYEVERDVLMIEPATRTNVDKMLEKVR